MKGIVITTENEISVQDFGKPLYKTAGEVVGGYIECICNIPPASDLVMLIYDEGKLLGLPLNPAGCCLYRTYKHGDAIVGNIVIMRIGEIDGEPDIVGLEDEYIPNLVSWFKNTLFLKEKE